MLEHLVSATDIPLEVRLASNDDFCIEVTSLLTWSLAEGGYFFLWAYRAIIATIVATVVAISIPNWNSIFIASYVTIYTPPFPGSANHPSAIFRCNF